MSDTKKQKWHLEECEFNEKRELWEDSNGHLVHLG